MAEADQSAWFSIGNYSVNLLDKLGQGAFGIVYTGKQNPTDRKVAVKEVKIEDERGGCIAARELKNLQRLPEHENLVAFLDFHFARNAIWMVMEYCDMGDLADYYQKYKPIHIATNVSFMCQIASAIAHMHSLPEPIVHRDLKPANILVKYCGDKPVVKVTDFGMAKVSPKAADLTKTYMMTTRCGTPAFMAPEQCLQQREGYSASVDVFAMGLILLGMLTYEKNKDLAPVIGHGMMMPVGMVLQMDPTQSSNIVPGVNQSDDAATKSLKDLFKRMIVANPKDRMKAADVSRKLTEIFAPLAPQLPPGPRPSDRTPVPESTDVPHSAPQDSPKTRKRHHPDLLYKLLHDAARQYAEDRLKKEKAKVDLDQLLKGKDIPLLQLLKRLHIDDVQDEAKGQELLKFQFKKGDRVKIDDCGGDISKAERLQHNYGGWVPVMATYLGKSGVVLGRTLNAVTVKFADRNKWAFNPVLVKKVEEDGSSPRVLDTHDYGQDGKSQFKRYDIVSIAGDKQRAKAQQMGHGGWNDKMAQCLGLKGIVRRVDKDGDVFVECNNKDKWYFNPSLLSHVRLTGEETLEPGDIVLVENDVHKVKALHQVQGGMPREIYDVIGHAVMVKKVLSDGRVLVEGGDSDNVVMKRKALKLVAKAEEMMEAILRKKFAI